MRAQLLQGIRDLSETDEPLELADVPEPDPGPGEIRIAVDVCGVCHTELDEIEGRTPPPLFPVIPGHQVIGRVDGRGEGAGRFTIGDRVGVAWIHSTCGRCRYCTSGRENLCSEFRATGRDANGGYAEYMTVREDFAFEIPAGLDDVQVAPLLCAGAIGYRSLRLTGLTNGDPLGLTGFGASGHLVLKMVRHVFPDSDVHVFARNPDEREFARELGAVWAGSTEDVAPELLGAVIDTTPAWKPVVEALSNLQPAGRLVINAIGKEAGDRDYLT
ncbi:MAG: alcohol dehydrogenase catalytic domain-containing protein, partial [Rhodothermales bacterium]|nr:alcohol dehydrogenase catalytic domain-containing protein [Rhodothermales bacterium]